MAKFHGIVGFGETLEARPGVWEDVITEKPYFGEVIRNTRQVREGEKVNDDFSLGNSITIVADGYANEHIEAMRFVEQSGSLWKISEVEIQRPRLILRLGGVYTGPRADPNPA